MDYLKVDVQGGELLVFHGAVNTLKHALVVHTEVEFVQMYKGQPLFADIDAFLRSHGFLLHKINAAGRTFKPFIRNNDVNAAGNQWLWGDAIYVRDFMAFETLVPDSLLRLATVMHENYYSFDLAAVALEAYDRQTGSRLQVEYIKRLMTS